MPYLGPERERICAVFSDGKQGSGYFIGPRLVLTAAHVVDSRANVRIAGQGFSRAPCSVAWMRHDDHCDAALLIVEGALPERFSNFPGVRLGATESLAPLPNCQAIGFPAAQRDESDRLDSEQLVGTLKPGSNMLRRRYVLDSSHTPPTKYEVSGSPWSGFSGAALFFSDVIMGVVGHDPASWQHSRVEATRASEMFKDPSFIGVLEKHTTCEYLTIPEDLAPERIFEERYREYIAAKYGTLTIFGIDLNDRSQREWPLDAAYLSLDAIDYRPAKQEQVDGGETIVNSEQPTRPAEKAFDGHKRVLLRGVAGSGKTTLVQWLAVSTAKREVKDGLHHLYGLVPFVLPLRALIRRETLPIPEEFLSAARVPLAGTQPLGWVENILADNRGLVLVDGLDEISEVERERVRSWLRELLIAFPANFWLVTSRPSAVADDWLASEEFYELSLSPMRREDVATFVRRWHRAAMKSCNNSDEYSRLVDYQEGLVTALREKHDLGRLATNPLMCGLICALHRDRRGYLPPGRKQLYDAALSMLLARRDRERELDVRLSEEPQIQLLQKLAYWLIRNGQVEMDRSDAISLIASALPSMPVVAQLGDAEQVYKYLLLRSGVLREPAEGVLDFVHRTFQDYLGAKSAVEERDFDLMVKNAHQDQWEDVLRMAVAHAYPTERARLLNKLVKRGDRVKRYRARLYLLAMACLEQAHELDPKVREEIESRASQLIPPENYQQAQNLASIGPMVLDMLPGPDRLTSEQMHAVVQTITFIGTDAGISPLARFRVAQSERVRDLLSRSWGNFDSRLYGQEIISHLPNDQRLWVNSDEQLKIIKELGERSYVISTHSCDAETLSSCLDPAYLRILGLHSNAALRDLGFLREYSSLGSLFLYNCSSINDLSPLRDLHIEELTINEMEGLNSFQGLSSMRHVKRLAFFRPIPGTDLSFLPREAPLRRLDFSHLALRNTGLRGLSQYTTVEEIAISRDVILGSEDWGEVNRLPQLRDLSIDRKNIPNLLHFCGEWPQVHHLALSGSHARALEAEVFALLAERFPNVRKVTGLMRDERNQVKATFRNLQQS